MPTVLAGETEHTRCPREKIGQGNFRKMVGGYGAYFFLCPSYSCITGMLDSLLIPSTCLESEVEFANIKIYLC